MSVIILNKDFNLNHSVALPTSKSVCNRLLVLRYLMNDSFDLKHVSSADDSQILVEIFSQETMSGHLDVKNAGTCFRFLTAVCASGKEEVILTGSEEMKRRPIKDLVDPLRQIGADISYMEKEGFPPLKINGKRLQGGKVAVNSEVSSQYISALLLIAPFLDNGLTIEVEGTPKSKSYSDMTISLLRKLGVEVVVAGKTISVSPFSGVFTREIEVDSDWSSASYWYELIALTKVNSKIQLKGVKTNSIQGDRVILELFKKFGVLTLEGSKGIEIVKTKEHDIAHFEADFSSIPDMVQTFVLTCVGLGINGTFKGISHLVYKETNRIEALKHEIEKLNYTLEMIGMDCFELIKRGELPSSIAVETYHDHRMAMSFAPLIAVLEKIEIENPEVVAKSYPEFWKEFI